MSSSANCRWRFKDELQGQSRMANSDRYRLGVGEGVGYIIRREIKRVKASFIFTLTSTINC